MTGLPAASAPLGFTLPAAGAFAAMPAFTTTATINPFQNTPAATKWATTVYTDSTAPAGTVPESSRFHVALPPVGRTVTPISRSTPSVLTVIVDGNGNSLIDIPLISSAMNSAGGIPASPLEKILAPVLPFAPVMSAVRSKSAPATREGAMNSTSGAGGASTVGGGFGGGEDNFTVERENDGHLIITSTGRGEGSLYAFFDDRGSLQVQQDPPSGKQPSAILTVIRRQGTGEARWGIGENEIGRVGLSAMIGPNDVWLYPVDDKLYVSTPVSVREKRDIDGREYLLLRAFRDNSFGLLEIGGDGKVGVRDGCSTDPSAVNLHYLEGGKYWSGMTHGQSFSLNADPARALVQHANNRIWVELKPHGDDESLLEIYQPYRVVMPEPGTGGPMRIFRNGESLKELHLRQTEAGGIAVEEGHSDQWGDINVSVSTRPGAGTGIWALGESTQPAQEIKPFPIKVLVGYTTVDLSADHEGALIVLPQAGARISIGPDGTATLQARTPKGIAHLPLDESGMFTGRVIQGPAAEGQNAVTVRWRDGTYNILSPGGEWLSANVPFPPTVKAGHYGFGVQQTMVQGELDLKLTPIPTLEMPARKGEDAVLYLHGSRVTVVRNAKESGLVYDTKFGWVLNTTEPWEPFASQMIAGGIGRHVAVDAQYLDILMRSSSAGTFWRHTGLYASRVPEADETLSIALERHWFGRTLWVRLVR